MSQRYEWDWPSRADERRRYFERVIDADYRVVRRRQTISFGWYLLIIGVATIFVLRFFWPALRHAVRHARHHERIRHGGRTSPNRQPWCSRAAGALERSAILSVGASRLDEEELTSPGQKRKLAGALSQNENDTEVSSARWLGWRCRSQRGVVPFPRLRG
jgi:hypothetical protein